MIYARLIAILEETLLMLMRLTRAGRHEKMDPTLRAYRERWRAVQEIEKEEQRAATMAQRWQQVNAILCLAIGLGLPLNEIDEQEQLIYQRWSKLRGQM